MTKVRAQLILELVGRPPEHIAQALHKVIDRLGSEKGITLLNQKHHDPKPLEKAQNLYSTFAEVDVEFDTLDHLFGVVMSYMPSNVEIYEPERFKLSVDNLNVFINNIVAKLHNYDEVSKRAIFERDMLVKQLQYIRAGGKIENVFKQPAAQQKQEPKKKPARKNTGKKKTAAKKSGKKKSTSARKKPKKR